MTTTPSAVDHTVLAELKDIMEDEFGALIETYLKDAEQRMQVIIQACRENQDADTLLKAAHSLKGSSSNIGAMLLAGICKQLEQAAREGELSQAAALCTDAQQAFTQLKQALQQFLP